MKILKIILILFTLILLVIGAGITYLKTAFPKVSAVPEMTVEVTPERVARGEYLANYVLACTDCHSERDWSKFSAPLVEGSEGKGGELFSRDFGFPGNFYAKNITPANLGDWTDGEIYRCITEGVTKEGNAMFPVMPYPSYASLDPEDVKDVIAYLRSLPAIENEVAESEADFPFSLILNTIPKAAEGGERPAESDQLAYGKYLFTVAACGDCHTPQEQGQAIEGLEYAGGFEFKMPTGGVVRSSNITPHSTGIGAWTEEQFLQRFKAYVDSTNTPILRDAKEGEFNSIMPWSRYAQMKESDLKAIYAYMQTLEPIEHQVERFTSSQ